MTTKVVSESVGVEDMAKMLAAIRPYMARRESASGILNMGQGHRIPIAAEQRMGLSVFDFTATPSKEYKLDAKDVQRLAQLGVSGFLDSVLKEQEPTQKHFLETIKDNKVHSARSLLAIVADEKKYDRELRDLAIAYLVDELSVDVLDELLADLKEGNEFIRFYVIKVLARMHSRHPTLARDIIEPIIASMRDPDKDIRWLTAVVLREIRDARAVEPLRNLSLTDPDPRVRQYAAAALEYQRG